MRISVIDSHTGGEPTRVVNQGFPTPPSGSTPADVRDWMRSHYDNLRRAIVTEPRGHEAMVGALLLPPADPANTAGVVFFNNEGYLGMCGHGTIGLVVTLKHLGWDLPATCRIETPVGVVEARLTGDHEVAIRNVPSRVIARDVVLPGTGLKGDVVYGGNTFFLVREPTFDLSINELPRWMQLSSEGLREVQQIYPDVDHLELFGPPQNPANQSRNYVLCPGLQYDRSPCGTGTSAKLAAMILAGQWDEGKPWRQESITGSVFTATGERSGDNVLVTILGEAFVTGETTLVLDPADPFVHGFPQ